MSAAQVELATLTAKQVAKLQGDYGVIQAEEAATAKKRVKLGVYVAGLLAAGATRRDVARALDVTDQTVTNIAFGRRVNGNGSE